jgi:uncharacterized surface protein with fasciclin (FAS1) repeats
MKKFAIVALALAAVAPALITSSAATPSIVGIASGDPQFSTLVTALKAADLVKTLEGKGPFTVFAPTNAAFAKIPKATLDALLKNKAELTKVLTYHVIGRKLLASSVVKLKTATTLEGSRVNIAVMGKTVEVNNARVTKPDIIASNGVIHVIDTVLMPKMR